MVGTRIKFPVSVTMGAITLKLKFVTDNGVNHIFQDILDRDNRLEWNFNLNSNSFSYFKFIFFILNFERRNFILNSNSFKFILFIIEICHRQWGKSHFSGHLRS
jgi:hypothetical protein